MFSRLGGLGIIIVLGADSAWATQPYSGQYVFSGTTPYAQAGCSVSGAGDVNNDGYDDIIIGTCGNEKIGSYTDRDSTGIAYVISGHDGTVLYVLTGENLGDMFGQVVGAAGDVNNDGYDDVIVGAPQLYAKSGYTPEELARFESDFSLFTVNDTVRGYARVFSGKDTLILATHYGSGPDSVFANLLSSKDRSVPSAKLNIGDINSDGINDYAIADRYADTNGIDSGSVWIYSGADNTVLYTFHGQSAYDYFGYAMSAAGDMDADGKPDLVVCAPGSDAAFHDAGTCYVVTLLAVPDDMQDRDHDSIADTDDNCPIKPNRQQEDGDHDGIGDMCDFDKDNDGVDDIDDYFPRDPLMWAWLDVDIDTIEDHSDNCPGLENMDQVDTDGDGSGDDCDSTPNGDNDNDGIDNLSDILPDNPYQCSRAGLQYAWRHKQIKAYRKVCRGFRLR